MHQSPCKTTWHTHCATVIVINHWQQHCTMIVHQSSCGTTWHDHCAHSLCPGHRHSLGTITAFNDCTTVTVNNHCAQSLGTITWHQSCCTSARSLGMITLHQSLGTITLHQSLCTSARSLDMITAHTHMSYGSGCLRWRMEERLRRSACIFLSIQLGN